MKIKLEIHRISYKSLIIKKNYFSGILLSFIWIYHKTTYFHRLSTFWNLALLYYDIFFSKSYSILVFFYLFFGRSSVFFIIYWSCISRSCQLLVLQIRFRTNSISKGNMPRIQAPREQMILILIPRRTW